MNVGAVNAIAVPHSLVALAPAGVVTNGAVRSSNVMLWLTLALLPQLSDAVHVRVIRFEQLDPLVTVTNVGVIDP